jgi:hypothetical protein
MVTKATALRPIVAIGIAAGSMLALLAVWYRQPVAEAKEAAADKARWEDDGGATAPKA